MNTHDLILNSFLKLGYSQTEGICHGTSVRWLEACLLDEENLFHERIKRIEQLASSNKDIVALMNAVKEKKGKNLSPKDKELLDILAFFESVELYQNPDIHAAFFGRPYPTNQEDVALHSDLASSDKINALGGLSQIYSEPLISNEAEIKRYLDELGVVMQSASVSSTEVLGVVLTSSEHTIALAYYPNIGWRLMDINHYPSEKFKIEQTPLLAKKIMQSLNLGPVSPFIAFNASVYTTKINPLLPLLTERLEQFKSSHKLTKERAHRAQNGVGLAWIAAQNNHVSVITELAKNKADFNKAEKEGFTPAHIAAQHGHVAAITELAKHGADLNKEDNDGFTPAHIAAQHGHVPVIIELTKNKADLKKTTHNGVTLVQLAALNGHVAAITQLAKYQLDFNKADKDGFKPVHLAALNGHADALAELKRLGADVNPSFISAQSLEILASMASMKGKDVVSRVNSFLSEHKNETQILMSPYDLAVIMGHHKTVQLLSKHTIQSYFKTIDLNRDFKSKTIESLDGEEKNNTNSLKQRIEYLTQLKDLKLQQETIELQFKEVDTLLEAAKKNEERVINRRYYFEFIGEYRKQYTKIMGLIPASEKEDLLQSEAKLRDSGIASGVLYGMSWATSLLTTGYRSLTPKHQQGYLESFLPQTLDGQCKVLFKKLMQERHETLKKELIEIEQAITHLNQKSLHEYEAILPFFNTISADSLGDLVKETETPKQQSTNMPYRFMYHKKPKEEDSPEATRLQSGKFRPT